MKALILVDVQNDFMPGGSLEVPGGDSIVRPLNAVQERFALVVATQDWHPPDHVSFASNHPGLEPFQVITIEGREQTLWPDHCVQGSLAAAFHTDLTTNRVEAVFRKGMDHGIDSYSAFYDNGHLKSTGLAGYLREKEAKELFFAGLAADICVYFTVRDALQEGFLAVVVEDAVCPLDLKDYSRKKEELNAQGVSFIKSGDIS